ncbi:hypothetical protein RB195_004209 [Necator americanus]|uniref:AT hook motif protein n=1 Tax=Necator americanus TaxID=51031 RepID=A0ABR1BKA0_NECAM
MVARTKKVACRGRGRPPKIAKDEDANGEEKTLGKTTKVIEKASTGRKRGRPAGSGKKKSGAKKSKSAPRKKKVSSDEESDHEEESIAAEENGEDKIESD